MRLCVLAALFVAFAASACAQISKGNLTGVVTDPSGSAVPSATVRLVNTGTGGERTEQSDSTGIYRFMTLDAGSYRVEVEAAGFKKLIRDGTVLRVGETTTLDLQLEVGQSTESVTVTAESSLLHTESASLGNTVAGLAVLELPALTRNPVLLIQMSPGIVYKSTGTSNLWDQDSADQFASSGTEGMAMFLMDGVPNMRVYSDGAPGGGIGYIPPSDAVEQVDAHTNAFDAEYGHSGGGVVSVTTKSGTNQVHSSIYWFLQNKDLNANTWFNNFTGTARPTATQNWYGAWVSGPVFLPKVYNGMNKTHFFFDFEGTHIRAADFGQYIVPTPLQLQGNFFQTTNAQGAAVTMYDPATTVASGSGYVRSAFPGNVIPASRIDPVARNFLKYYPAPNTTPTSANLANFVLSHPRGTQWESVVGRVDHQLTSKHLLFFRWGWNKRHDSTTSTYGPCCLLASANDDYARGNIMGAIGDTWLLNARTVVDFRIGFYRYFDAVIPWSTGFDMTTLGFPASFANAVDYKWFPRITMTDGDTINFSDSRAANVNYEDSFSPLVNVHTNIGRHALKYGFTWQAGQLNRFLPGNATATLAASQFGFAFDRTFTRGPNPTVSTSVAGNDFADFLLGDVTSGSYPKQAGQTSLSTFSGFYFQDDWKVTDRLTLNLGLRFEHERPGTERFNRGDGGFATTAVSPLQAAAQANYAKNPIPQLPLLNVMGGLTFLGVNGEPRGYVNLPALMYEPRFGYAYRISNKIVWRGGWGLYYIPLNLDYFQNTGFTTNTQMVTSLDGNLTPYNTLSNPFPNGLSIPAGSSGGLLTSLGQSITAGVASANGVANFTHGLSQQFSMGFQFLLPGNISLETSYAGNDSQHLTLTRNANLYPNQYLSLGTGLNTKVPNPFYGLITDPTSALSQATTTVAQLLSPYPEFTGLTESMLPKGRSDYNSLQVNVQKRMSHGLYFGAMYMFSKYMQAGSYLNANDAKPSWAIADLDRPQRLVLSGVYQLPVGKGKRFLNSAPGAVQRVLGDWQVTWDVTFQSGPPLSFASAVRTTKSSNNPHTIIEWFDTTQFTPLPPFTLNTLSAYVNDVRGAGVNIWNLTAAKQVPITERVKLNLRAEFYNAFNVPQFGNPNTTVTSTSFGRVTSASNSRVIQVSGRINF